MLDSSAIDAMIAHNIEVGTYGSPGMDAAWRAAVGRTSHSRGRYTGARMRIRWMRWRHIIGDADPQKHGPIGHRNWSRRPMNEPWSPFGL